MSDKCNNCDNMELYPDEQCPECNREFESNSLYVS